jgi:hypothetical protein
MPMKKYLLLCTMLVFSNSANSFLLPLSNMVFDRNNLSKEDVFTLSQRCYVVNEISYEMMKNFSRVGEDISKIEHKRDVFSKVYTQMYALLALRGSKNKTAEEVAIEYGKATDSVFVEYFHSMKDNKPIPYSLSSALLATDIGTCNELTNEFEKFSQMIDRKLNK